MIIDKYLDLIFDELFLRLDESVFGSDCYLKLEGCGAGGSVKIKPAIQMIEDLESSGVLKKGMRIIESSSGNLGIALSIVCASKGYDFTCVIDPNILPSSERVIRSYGTDVVKVTNKDSNGGYLASRINYINSRLSNDPNLIWTNQYTNFNNVRAHYLKTAPSIARNFVSDR